MKKAKNYMVPLFVLAFILASVLIGCTVSETVNQTQYEKLADAGTRSFQAQGEFIPWDSVQLAEESSMVPITLEEASSLLPPDTQLVQNITAWESSEWDPTEWEDEYDGDGKWIGRHKIVSSDERELSLVPGKFPESINWAVPGGGVAVNQDFYELPKSSCLGLKKANDSDMALS